jgi:hypothetical protein
LTLRGRRLVFLGVAALALVQIGLVVNSVMSEKPSAQAQTVPGPAK